MLLKYFTFIALVATGSTALAADFRGTGADGDLTIDVVELRGVKPKTKSQSFVKAYLQRGKQNFEVFCYRKGSAERGELKNSVSCSKGVETVSNDDDESLGFDLTWYDRKGRRTLQLENIEYSGDGTFLGKEVAVLLGQRQQSDGYGVKIELKPDKRSWNPAFGAGELINRVLVRLIGKTHVVRENGVEISLKI